MRAVRLAIAWFILSPIFILAIGESSLAPRLHAQVAAAPGPAPLVPPAAPGQPVSFSTIGALPPLAPAPGSFAFALATPQATPRVFRCTCSGPGFHTAWSGNVSSPSYVLARQAASGQCIGFNTNDHAPSAYIAQRSLSSTTQLGPTFYNGTAFTARGQAASSAIVTSPVQQAKGQVAAECTQCACN